MSADNKHIYLITTQQGDVTGDGILDTVSLTGYKEKPADIFIKNISLIVQDGKTKQSITTTFKNNAGYNPRLFLGDFTCDGTDDVLVSIDSGGSGGFGYYYIYSFVNNTAAKLFDVDDFNTVYKYDVDFRDGCRVQIYSKYSGKSYYVDVSARKDFYVQEGVYNKNCKLLKPTEGFVPGLNTLYPVAAKQEGKYDILVLLKIAGLFNADTLGYIEMKMSWDGSSFKPISERIIA